MMNDRCICAFIIIIVGISVLSVDVQDKTNTLLHLAWRLSDAVNDFALSLHGTLARNSQHANLVCSPLSVTNTLAMLHFGAKGRTARELERVLAYEKANLTRISSSRAYKYLLTNILLTNKPRYNNFELTNVIFLNKNLGISSSYKRKAEDYFRSPLKLVNFADKSHQTMIEVNQWVRDKTRNKIKRITNYLDPTVDIVIVNTVFFKGQWSSPFRLANTRDQIFYNAGVKRKFVPMMKQENIFFYGRDDKTSFLELPFKGNNMSMIFMLPNKMNGLVELEQNINLEKMFKYLEITALQRVLVTIPKFRIVFSAELIPVLQSMGLTQLFEPSHANLSGMLPGSNGVSIGYIKHRVTIDIDEYGVEASASTAAATIKSASDPDEEFFADHPFMFAVLDKRNGMLLFLGRIWKF